MNEAQAITGLIGVARDLTVISVLVILTYLWLSGRIMTRAALDQILAIFKEVLAETKEEAKREREDRIKAQEDTMEALRGMARGVEVADTVVQVARARSER